MDTEHGQSSLAPPVAPVHPVVREHHGHRFVDDYEWLRDGDDPDVLAHLEAENAYATARTEHLGGLRGRLFEEIRSHVQETDLSVPVASGPWWYLTRTVEGEQYAVHTRLPRRPGDPRPVLDAAGFARTESGLTLLPGEEVVLDTPTLAGDAEFFEVGIFTVSPDHGVLAVGVDRAGDERFDVTIRDLRTGEVLDEALTGVGYGLELTADAAYVFYTRLDDAWRSAQLWRHRVGTDGSDDVLVHDEVDERFWVSVGSSRDERWIVLAVGSKTTSEVHLLAADDPLGAFRCVAPRADGVEYDVEPAEHALLVVHNRDNPEFDLAWAPLTATSPAQWSPLVTAGPGERVLGVDAFAGHAVLALRRAGLRALRVLPRDPSRPGGYGPGWDVDAGEGLHTLDLADNPEWESPTVLLSDESFVRPRTVRELDLATGESTVVREQPVPGYDPADYREERLWARAADGSAVPVSLVHRADVVADGSNPGFLYAYGAYEASMDPWFSVARLCLLDRGVVFAVAHVRGGGEMGRRWYDEGRLATKPNTFTDTLAARDALVGAGWFDGDRVALEGGSAGGLLVGAVLNARPEAFRVAHAAVPFVDALTTILRPDLPLTVGEWDEWGNPLADPAAYALMRSYTPYENVRAVPYPAILATTSLHDTRVFFTEPAKWVARLRATVTNDPVTAPILLRTEIAAGHGGRSGRYAVWEQTAWEWSFVLDRLGATERLPDLPDRPKEHP